MRQELTAVGAKECRTSADVDAVLKEPGVVMMVVNSVCGCAAGKARPGIAMALQHDHKPSTIATVFAGADIEATDRVREFTTGFAPSSPSIALFQDGKLVYMVERRDIEQRNAEMIADLLTMAFDKYCATEQVRYTRYAVRECANTRNELTLAIFFGHPPDECPLGQLDDRCARSAPPRMADFVPCTGVWRTCVLPH